MLRKILVAYDGSECALTAVHDLKYAGLPINGIEVKVLSVGEYQNVLAYSAVPYMAMANTAVTSEYIREIEADTIASARNYASQAADVLKGYFPEWIITHKGLTGSPATEILQEAKNWDADMIILGSHGRGRIGRAFMGSVSLRVVTEAQCSVRVVKREPEMTEPVLLLAFDGSSGSRAAIRSLVHRTWPKETMLYILSVADSTLLSAWDYLSISKDEVWDVNDLTESKLEHVMDSVQHELSHYFTNVTSQIVIGTPTKEILRKAKELNASTIFLGACGFSKLERMLLGSVAMGVAAKAESAVEIIR